MRWHTLILTFTIALSFAFVPSIATAAEKPDKPAKAEAAFELPDVVRFNRDIRPILSDNCFYCHGPDAGHREAKLRLDVKEHAFADRDGFPAIKPGDLEASEAWVRITSPFPEDRMPPVEAKKTLTKKQIALIKKWIEQGAPWEGHWSFAAPSKPALPQVSDEAWCRTPIDYFILNRLDREGLKPSPEADRATLIRRVSYDVTGLPPTLAELDRFLADSTDDWYERVVDYYLSRPAYGERMALAWMDAGRYGDSSVFHADGPRDMWPWRDWVINAYNGNIPFDQFTIEQLAGDLLPDATADQKIASGFHRNHGTTDEGGAIAEEYRVEYVVDRVMTTGNVWLGLSMECAQCHDHKFDPVTQKEYYGFYAFFNQTTDPGMQTRNGNQAPLVNVPDPQRDAEIAKIAKQIEDANKQLAAHVQAIEPAFEQWVAEQSQQVAAGNKPAAPDDMLVHLSLDDRKGNKASDSIDPKRKGDVKGPARWVEGKLGGAFRTDGKSFITFGKDVANFDRTDQFSYGCWIKPAKNAGTGAPLAKMDNGNGYRGYDLWSNADGRQSVHIIHAWPGDAIKVTTKGKIPAEQWTHVFVTYDGSSKAGGVKIYFNGEEQPWDIEQNGLKSTTKGDAPLNVGRRHPNQHFTGEVDDVRIFARTLSQAEVAAVAGGDPLAPILALEPDKRTKEQVETLRTHYLQSIDKEYGQLTQQKTKLAAEIEKLKKSTVTSMIMGEQPKPRDTFVLMRGHYASPDKSEVIEPAVPSVFPPLPEGAPRNRLGLAKWLMSDEHPLTARVTVNRYWAMLFGQGIVSSVMDFGSQGAWPTHPELLDWLAVDFRENEWNVKRSLKQMLMSATYRQSSRQTPELREKDPANELLARGPRFRLQGEFIRDAALAASGLMVDEVGGPGVKPYQPPGLWNEVSLTGNVRFVQDKGEKLYRKSMYIYWKRSSPHPGMMIFDAPTREKCVMQRPVTNTPLQALYTLNDTQFVEAARALAQRMMQEGGDSAQDRTAFAYRLVTSRQPSARAIGTLLGLYKTELAKYQNDAQAAKELLGVGESSRDESLDAAEHAAWTVVASVILNMDAALTKY